MTLVDLSSQLVFSTFLIFCRIGAAIMFVPAIGETSIPARIRLIFAVLFSLILLPIYQDIIPPLPKSVSGLALLIGSEVTIGLVIGLIMKVILSALHTFGITGPGVANLNRVGSITENTYSSFISGISDLLADAYEGSNQYIIYPQLLE